MHLRKAAVHHDDREASRFNTSVVDQVHACGAASHDDGCEVPGGTSSSASLWPWQLRRTTARSRTALHGGCGKPPGPGRTPPSHVEEGPIRLVQSGSKRSSSLWRGTQCPNVSVRIGTDATGIQSELISAPTTASQNSDVVVITDAFSLSDQFLILGSCNRCAAIVTGFELLEALVARTSQLFALAQPDARSLRSTSHILQTFARPLARGHEHLSKSYFLLRVRSNA